MNNRHRTTHIIAIITLLLSILCIPFIAEASRIYTEFPRSQTNVEDLALIKVMLNTEGSSINVVDGTVTVNNPDDVAAISTGGSVLSLWPTKPSLDGNKISFVGGTPSGVKGAALTLFTIAVQPSKADSIEIGFNNVATYLNDGKGTKILASGSTQSLAVETESEQIDNQLATLISDDKTPPEPFTIELGSDPALYDGKYFISFYTTDNQSGINHYEVTESGFQTVRSGNVYVLQDQTRTKNIEIRVFDNAGNIRIQKLTFTPEISKGSLAILISIGFIILLIVGFIFRKRFTMKT
jgi:hypothetical protein